MASSVKEAVSTAPEANAEGQASRWYLLGLLVIGYAVYNVDKSIVSVLIEPLKAEFHLSDSAIGALTGIVTSLPFALSCIPLGLLGDRLVRKRLLAFLIA